MVLVMWKPPAPKRCIKILKDQEPFWIGVITRTEPAGERITVQCQTADVPLASMPLPFQPPGVHLAEDPRCRCAIIRAMFEPPEMPSGTGRSVIVRRTTASVFVIESLEMKDEDEQNMEGEILSKMLALSRKDTDYRYIRTLKELEAMAQQFTVSKRRYLHISCHGNKNGLSLTLDQAVTFAELGTILRPHLKQRRLFVSACSAVNGRLADAIMRNGGCLSIVGPAQDVDFDAAAVMWAAFYHVMFKESPNRMTGIAIESALRRLQLAFKVPMRYIKRTSVAPFWKEVKLS